MFQDQKMIKNFKIGFYLYLELYLGMFHQYKW